MTHPSVTLADWRAQVDKELAGAPFEKALVHTSAEGLSIQPLYTETQIEPGLPGAAPFLRGARARAVPFRICMRHDGVDRGVAESAGGRGIDLAAVREDLEGGAEALWLSVRDPAEIEQVLAAGAGGAFLVIDAVDAGAAIGALSGAEVSFALGADPIGAVARGRASAADLAEALAALGPLARRIDRGAAESAGGSAPRGINASGRRASAVLVSTLGYHAAGADAADEIALALSTGVAYLGALLEAGLELRAAARQIAMQIAVGRDTFGELCKLRALRLGWHKVLAAAGAPDVPLGLLHAVSSSRTLTERDPWVNMLRVTTQVFASVLGGADLVTPASFDEALGAPSQLGRRIARNTALVLREESHLGRVMDPSGGSYYLETRTDALAREAWQRFRSLEREGGVVQALASGALAARLETAWKKRRDAIAKRKEPITGVSEFANLDELALPSAAPAAPLQTPGLPSHRDAEPFEQLRARANALAAGGAAPEVVLVTLGPPAEHRARAGFSSAFFAAGGIRAHEISDPRQAGPGTIACLCGSDERYAHEAVARASELKAAGCQRVLLAGRPGALEPALRAAGVDGFIFVGCDVVATLAQLLGGIA